MQNFEERKYFLIALYIIIGVIFTARLFYIQVIKTEYRTTAENNSTRHVVLSPGRGLIYDRDSSLLVYNTAFYDILCTPRKTKPFDTLMLADLLGEDVIRLKAKLKKITKSRYLRYRPNVIAENLSADKYAKLQEFLFLFKGFSVKARMQRKYNTKSTAHVLGYVAEVGTPEIAADNYYSPRDLIGKSGVEKAYEKLLRGEKGNEILLVDVLGNIKGSYKNKNYDTLPENGTNVYLSLSNRLQQYGEELMQNKIGSVVAIEPSTGEILSLISSPAYNPNVLVGQERNQNYRALALNDSLKPLFNRATMALYPPGSTFKIVNALIGLHEGVITERSTYSCYGGYYVGNFHMGCHHYDEIDFLYSIQGSCNAYYANVFRRILDNKKYESIYDAYKVWNGHVKSFGLGQRLGSDVQSELKGLVPDAKYFDKKYGGYNRWRSLYLVSMGIGQGELGTTPLQMANMTAAIANRGYYFTPHLIKLTPIDTLYSKYTEKHYTSIDSVYFEPVIEGMELVTMPGGTAQVARIKGVSVCGKTGTAQNPRGDDHSIFVAFAPRENPKIAIAVYVENAGFGSTWAAPIASLMIEKYLNDSTARPWLEERMIKGNLIDKLFEEKE